MNELSQRQHDIIALARRAGWVTVDDLAARFDVTPQTVRKDLNTICDLGLLRRIHGGAEVAGGIENLRYEARRQLARDAKQAIGRAAAELIPDNSTLFINIGTTTEEVARNLFDRRELVVITNNINVANLLRQSPDIQVIIAGGIVRRSDGGIVGETAIDFINQFRVDYAIIGTSAIDDDGTLRDYDLREVKVAQAIISNSRHVILVTDRMKLDRSAPVRVAHLSQVETFVIDSLPSQALREVCRENHVRVIETS